MKNILYIISYLFLVSCIQKSGKAENKDITVDYNLNTVENLVGKNDYWAIFNELQDTLKDHLKEGIIVAHMKEKRLLDTVLCVNKKKDRVVAFFIHFGDSISNDSYQFIYGAKYGGKWYFRESNVQPYITRDNGYKLIHKDILNHTIGYLKKDKYGKIYLNDEFFYFHIDRYGLSSAIKKGRYPWNMLNPERYNMNQLFQVYYQNKNTYKIFKPNIFSFDYNFKTKELTIKSPVKKWHEFPIGFKYCIKIHGEKKSVSEWENNYYFVKKSDQILTTKLINIGPNQKIEFSYWYAPTTQGVDVPLEYLFSYKKGKLVCDTRRKDQVVRNVFYQFQLVNGKAHFVHLIPDHDCIPGGMMHLKDSIIAAHQKLVDDYFGKDYGK